jgi:hypothetical protein
MTHPSIIHESYLGHDPNFTGIHEAYEYRTTEGWWVIDACYSDPTFGEWLINDPPDWWISEHRGNLDQRSDECHTILIKDIKYLTRFRLRWYSEKEYMKSGEDRFSAKYHLSNFFPNWGWWPKGQDYVELDNVTLLA